MSRLALTILVQHADWIPAFAGMTEGWVGWDDGRGGRWDDGVAQVCFWVPDLGRASELTEKN